MVQIWTWNDSLSDSKEDAAFGTFWFGTANMVGWLLMAFPFHVAFLALERRMRPGRTLVVRALAWRSPFLSATFWIVIGLVESPRRARETTAGEGVPREA